MWWNKRQRPAQISWATNQDYGTWTKNKFLVTLVFLSLWTFIGIANICNGTLALELIFNTCPNTCVCTCCKHGMTGQGAIWPTCRTKSLLILDLNFPDAPVFSMCFEGPDSSTPWNRNSCIGSGPWDFKRSFYMHANLVSCTTGHVNQNNVSTGPSWQPHMCPGLVQKNIPGQTQELDGVGSSWRSISRPRGCCCRGSPPPADSIM